MRITHCQLYGVVMVSRNLERANENDGFKVTALEWGITSCHRICIMIGRVGMWGVGFHFSLPSISRFGACFVLRMHERNKANATHSGGGGGEAWAVKLGIAVTPVTTNELDS